MRNGKRIIHRNYQCSFEVELEELSLTPEGMAVSHERRQAAKRTVPEACLHRRTVDPETWIPGDYSIGVCVETAAARSCGEFLQCNLCL